MDHHTKGDWLIDDRNNHKSVTQLKCQEYLSAQIIP